MRLHQFRALLGGQCVILVIAPPISAFQPGNTLAFYGSLRYLTPMTNESIENLARKLAETVPEGLRSMREDLEQNFRSVLRTSLGKLDLVTRDEFEVQQAVLARTREKLEALEKTLQDHEERAS